MAVDHDDHASLDRIGDGGPQPLGQAGRHGREPLGPDVGIARRPLHLRGPGIHGIDFVSRLLQPPVNCVGRLARLTGDAGNGEPPSLEKRGY